MTKHLAGQGIFAGIKNIFLAMMDELDRGLCGSKLPVSAWLLLLAKKQRPYCVRLLFCFVFNAKPLTFSCSCLASSLFSPCS